MMDFYFVLIYFQSLSVTIISLNYVSFVQFISINTYTCLWIIMGFKIFVTIDHGLFYFPI